MSGKFSTGEARPLFIAEGRYVVRRLLSLSQWRLRELLLTPVAEAALRGDLARTDAARRPDVRVVDQAELDRIGGFKFHQGCLGYAERPATQHWRELDLAGEWVAPIVVLEAVRDPDNLGSIFRSALGFGARAVLIGPSCADPLYRKTVRTSMAAVLALPFAEASPWPEMLHDLRAAGYTLVALTPDADAEALPDAAASLGRSRVALLLGSEGEGLSPAALAAVDRRVRIPMAPSLDSLNVATAAAVALYALSAGRGAERCRAGSGVRQGAAP